FVGDLDSNENNGTKQYFKSKWTPYVKYYLENRTKRPSNLWVDVEGNKKGSLLLKEIFGAKIFDNPKPLEFIVRIIQIACNQDSIILDFFAGSATTAHGVLAINKQDNGNRKFIMVQLPEPCVEDSEAFKAGYRTIAEIGKERIRRAIKSLNEEDAEKLDLDDYTKQDRGFKVLSLDKSNFKQWQKLAPDTKPADIISQLESHIDHVDHKATQEDLLYEILLKAGFTLTEKIETKAMASKQVFSVGNGELLICLENEITKELINAVANTMPGQFICLDSAFGGNDQLKVNAFQIFNAFNTGKENHNQVVFKTV
nr:site-specific DNA-methyltransferase [Nostocaceae cyanobacterium]